MSSDQFSGPILRGHRPKNHRSDPSPAEIFAMCELIQESWTPAEERTRRLNDPAADQIIVQPAFRVPTVRTDRDIRPTDGAGLDL